MEKKRYGAIDGLRMFAAFGIVLMHLAANNTYEIPGFLYNEVIPSFTNFVYLFMEISAFSMCCGYYEKVMGRQISFSEFYGKRFKKILPFFGVLVLLDILISPSSSSIYEGFADLTLLFGFLPEAGDISVVGVGWFIGLIFVFYLTFPFFCTLLENRRRAWCAFAISLAYNFVCADYFEVGRTNILYSGCFFLAGGLAYLYREELQKLNGCLALVLACASVVLYYTVGGNAIMCLLVSSALLIYAVSAHKGGVLDNRVTRFFGSISMEIYLSHMVVFRLLEKLHLNHIFEDDVLQYAFLSVSVIAGTTLFAIMMKKLIGIAIRLTEHLLVRVRGYARQYKADRRA